MLLLIMSSSLLLFFAAMKSIDISIAIIENAAAAVLAAGYLIGKKLVEK